MRQRITTLLAVSAVAMTASNAFAQDNQGAAQQAQQGQQQQAQQQRPLVEQYEDVLDTIAGLQVYNSLLERQIQTQQQEIEEIRQAINEVPDLERQIPPLLIRMVDGLERFIELDLPFLAEERAERLAELQAVVERSDVNDAEKFRRVLEAWEVENEYGRTASSYVGQLQIDGNTREVDFLRIGRVALLYQTTDDAGLTGAWDPRSNGWVSLPSQHRNSVRQALRMTRNQIAPELVLIPVTPPTTE